MTETTTTGIPRIGDPAPDFKALTTHGEIQFNSAPRSSTEPKTLGESKRGTQSHSIAPSGATRAPVWQSERNP